MPTNNDNEPSAFAKYISGSEETERPSPLEDLIKQSRRHAGLKTFLMDVLMNGPVPATSVEQRGAIYGFTEKQIRHARKQMNIVAFKETGKPRGRWLLALPHDNRSSPAQQATPNTVRF